MTCTKLDLFFRRVTLWQRPMGPQELFHQRKREKKPPNSESPTFLNTSHTSVVSRRSLWSVPESCQPGPCPGCAAGNQFRFVWGMHKLRHVRPEQEPTCSPCTSHNVPADVVAESVCKKHWCPTENLSWRLTGQSTSDLTALLAVDCTGSPRQLQGLGATQHPVLSTSVQPVQPLHLIHTLTAVNRQPVPRSSLPVDYGCRD